VTKFMVDTLVSYSEAEHRFFKGSRGNYLKCSSRGHEVII